MKEERLRGGVPDVLQDRLVSRRISESNGQVLVLPSSAAVSLGEVGQAWRLIRLRPRQPDILDSLNLRVRSVLPLDRLAQVEDAADVALDPGHCVGILAGVLQSAAAEDAPRGDLAAGHGANVAGVDERLGGDKGGSRENREERFWGNGLADMSFEESVELGR